MIRGLARRARNRAEAWAAARAARRAVRTRPAPLRVCWDLDNTLVASGELLRRGRLLDDAIVEAEPVPNMLEFYAAMQRALPDASHLFLSARLGSMRKATLAWLEARDLFASATPILLVPNAEAKRRIWKRLADDAPLVIVDDLSYDHELPEPSIYHELVEFASRTSHVYIGYEEITRIASDADAIEAIAARTTAALADQAG
jgi:hypothetical protein